MPSIAPGARAPAVAFILVTAALDVMALGIVIPVMPALVAELAGPGAPVGFVNGVMIAIWAFFQLLAAPAVGLLSDRYGRRPVLLASAAGLGADYLLMAVAPNLWWLALGRAIAGVTGASFTVAFAYMADVTPPAGRARAFGWIGAAWSAGFVAGPLLGGWLGIVSPRAPFWAAGTLSFLVLLLGFVALPETLPPDRRTAFSWRRANPLGAFDLLRRPALRRWAVVLFLVDAAHHVYTAIYVLYAAARFGWGAWEVGLVLAVVGLLDVGIQAGMVGPATRRYGERGTVILGCVGGAAGLLSMSVATGPLAFALAVVPNALWGLATPSLQSLMSRAAGEDEQGRLQGANGSLQSLAGILAPPAFGAAYGLASGPGAVLPWAGAPFGLAALCLVLATVAAVRPSRAA